MAKIIQFPSKEELNSKEQKQMLNRHLDLLEDDLRTAMSQLDELNEEIVSLTPVSYTHLTLPTICSV